MDGRLHWFGQQLGGAEPRRDTLPADILTEFLSVAVRDHPIVNVEDIKWGPLGSFQVVAFEPTPMIRLYGER